MFPSWHFILFIIVFDSVFVRSAEKNNNTNGVNKEHARVAPKKNDLLMRKVKPDSRTDLPGHGLLDAKENLRSKSDGGDDDSGSGTDSNDAKYNKNKLKDNDEDSAFNTDSNEAKYNKNKNDKDNDNDEDSYSDDDISDDENNSNQDQYENQDDEDDSDVVGLKRALQAGDTFTPMELLPVATKFFKKAKATMGENQRGIVSGSKYPEEVADKIFRAYFTTDRRIVELTAQDLSGLDALTALALEGEAVAGRSTGDSITERPVKAYQLNGQLILADEEPLRCHYKLMYKKVRPSDSILRKRPYSHMTPFPKVLKMEKKMRPNRHLVINRKGRKSRKNNNKDSSIKEHGHKNEVEEQKLEIVKMNGTEQIKMTRHEVDKERKQKARKRKIKRQQNKKGRKLTRNNNSKKHRKSRKRKSKLNSTETLKHLRNKNIDTQAPLSTTLRPACTWRYICQIPSDLDTCRLQTSCVGDGNNQPMIEKSIVDTKENDIKDREKTELVMHFRKMLGITDLDEQVEKIIEQHVLLVKPHLMAPDERIETLDEYFNRIIQAQYTSTTPPPPLIHVLDQSKDTLEDSLSEEVLRNLNSETVKAKNTDIPNEGKTQKLNSLSGPTASMKAVTSKYNKNYMM